MKNLLLLLSCFFATILMSSCTVDSVENESFAGKTDDVSTSKVPVDHGHDDKDKDKDNN